MRKVTRPKTGKRILLIEDDRDVRMLLQHVLLSAGYEVDSADTVAEGLVQLESHSYQLVMTDDRLPDGRGILVADQAREKGVPALVITGYMLQASKIDLERHEHLMKPVRPAELVEAVERHITKSED